jgi:MGT family glycosyltransferase
MGRVLIYTAPGSGHLYPLIPTVEELRGRGHDVLVCAEERSMPLLRRLGVPGRPIAAEIERRVDDTWQARTPIGALRRSVRMYVDRARHEVADVRGAMDEHAPDAVMVDNNCWGAGAAVEAAELPWAQIATFLLPLTTPDAPPFGLGLRPSTARAARWRDAVLRTGALPLFDAMLPPVNRLRAQLGLPRVRHVPELYMRAPLVLSYTGHPLEYPRTSLPASVCMVGACAWDPAEHHPEPGWLAALRRPIVLVTCSSQFQNDARLIQTALDALADSPYDVVATTASIDPDRFRRPANAEVHRFVPHSLVLARAAAVVCHAGMGITQKALLAGVPVCAVPFGRDQLEVARRVEVAGAGVRLPAGRLTVPRLRRAVARTVLLREGAQAAGAALAAVGGARAAVNALEELLSEHPDRNPAGGPPPAPAIRQRPGPPARSGTAGRR